VSEDKKELAQAKPSALLADSMSVDDVVKHMELMREAMKRVMVKNEDYRSFGNDEKGREKKPTLQKPGAEKLCVLFRLAPSFETRECYDGKHLTVSSRCTLSHINSGKIVGSGNGMCSTKENNYAKLKVGGKYIDHPDLPSIYNTVTKMADKRSLVAAVLVATAASSMFTQDMGDDEKPEDHHEEAPKPPAPTKEIEGKSEVKDPPQSKPITDSKCWVGVLADITPMVKPPNTKFLKITGADGFVVLFQQPNEKAKADLDLYKAIWGDLAKAVDSKEEVEILYGVSAIKNNLFQGWKIAEKSVLA
jgi:hypothetical protein